MSLDKKSILKILGILSFGIILYCALQNFDKVRNFIGVMFSYISPFLIGAAIAFIFNVPMRALEKHIFPKAKSKALNKLRRPLSLVLTLLIICAAIAAVVIIVAPQLTTTIKSLAVRIPDYMVQLQSYLEKTLASYPEIQKQITDINIDWQSIIGSVSGWLTSGVTSTLSFAGNAISGVVSAVVGFVFSIYILLQKERLGRQVRMIVYAFVQEKRADKFFEIIGIASDTFSKFISGQCLEACILGLMFALAMAIFRMPYIALVSVLIAFMALIPIIGAFIGCFVGAFLILMQNPIQALWFIVMFLVIQQIEGNLIYPRVVGNSVGLPAIWVLAVVTLGGNLFGVVGMLVMIPLSSVFYALFREYVVKRLHGKGEAIQRKFFVNIKPKPKPEGNSEAAPPDEDSK